MPTKNTTVCEFCATVNPSTNDRCLACGAPITPRTPTPVSRPVVAEESPAEKFSPTPSKTSQQLQQARETGEQVEKVARGALYAYSLLWRTLAEAAAIAMTGFGIGMVGGATGAPFWGVLGASTVGMGVGLAIKISYLALFSAPVGLVIGAIAGVLLFILGGGIKVFVFTTAFFALLAAILGGRHIPFAQRNLYEKLRPLIGAAGGLLFGLLGMLLGLGLRAAVNNLLVPVN